MSLSFRPKLAKNIDQIGDDISDILNTSLTGFIVGANTPITSSNTVLTALEVVQGQLNAISATEVTSVSGTSNRITASPTTGNVIVDISASYVGQSSITTLGTIGTGIWNGTAITDSNLASSYLYSNGTRSLTGNWAAGAFYISANQLGAGTGSTTPVSMLQVVETSIVVPRGILSDQYNTGTQGSRITMRKARGTFGTPLIIVTGDVLASWTAAGYDGVNFIDSSKILVTSIGTIGTGIIPSTMSLQTMNSAGTLTTALTIDQAQAVTLASTLNKLTITAPATSATLTIADGSSLITSGAFGITLTTTGNTNITLPTSGTLVGGTGTSGQISYWNGTNSQAGNSSLIYDATNIFVGIGGTPVAKVHLSGNISVPAFTINGIGIRDQAATYIDTTSTTGTVAAMYGNYFGVKTFNTTNASVVVTALYSNFFEAPLVTGNLTATNSAALGLGGNLFFKAGTTAILGTFDSQNLGFRTNNITRITILADGKQSHVQSAQSSGTSPFITWTQADNTGGSSGGILYTAGSTTSQTTATNITDINFNLSAVMKVVDGTTALMRGMLITGRTYTPQTSALTVTNASTLDVVQSIAGSGTTITSNYAQRWLFDNSNYVGFIVSSVGSLNISATGTGATINIPSNALIVGNTISTSGTLANANLSVIANANTTNSFTQSELLFSGATIVNSRITERGTTNNIPAIGSSYASHIIGTQLVTIAGSGTHALFANMVINPVSITAGSGALTSSASLYINGAASGAVTNYSLWVASGVTRLDGDLKLSTAGNGLYIKEGSNATMGTGTLSAGTLVISNTKVTANSEIFLTDKGGGVLANIGALNISAKSAGVSFTVSSSNALDTSAFSWIIIEPAP